MTAQDVSIIDSLIENNEKFTKMVYKIKLTEDQFESLYLASTRDPDFQDKSNISATKYLSFDGIKPIPETFNYDYSVSYSKINNASDIETKETFKNVIFELIRFGLNDDLPKQRLIDALYLQFDNDSNREKLNEFLDIINTWWNTIPGSTRMSDLASELDISIDKEPTPIEVKNLHKIAYNLVMYQCFTETEFRKKYHGTLASPKEQRFETINEDSEEQEHFVFSIEDDHEPTQIIEEMSKIIGPFEYKIKHFSMDNPTLALKTEKKTAISDDVTSYIEDNYI